MVVPKKFWISDMEALLGIVVVLLILGTINVLSSSFILSETNYNTPYHFLIRHLINLSIGSIFLFLGWRVNYHRWRAWMPAVVLGTYLALILVLIIGVAVNGSRRWLNLIVFQVQPAEIAKLVAIMLAAAYLSSRVHRGKEPNLLNLQMGLIVLMGGLVELEPDMGTMCIVIGVPFCMTLIAGLNWRKIVPAGALVTALLGGLCLLQPYRLQRLKVFFDPWADARNVGYQIVQSLSAIGSGGFWGMGLGMGISKYDYLPEAHTDFAFAVFCQENGFLGAIFMFMLFAALAFYAARIANKAKDAFGQMLGLGILILLVGQAVINLLMVGGVLPVIGVPLPFVSYGGTSLMISMASVGILLNIGRHGQSLAGQDTQEEEPMPQKKRTLYLVKR